MRGWTKRVALAGLLGGLAAGAGGCRLETSTLGVDAQPVDYGTGGAGQAGQPSDTAAPAEPQHGEGLGNVIDGHGYERHRGDGPAPAAGPGPVSAQPSAGGH